MLNRTERGIRDLKPSLISIPDLSKTFRRHTTIDGESLRNGLQSFDRIGIVKNTQKKGGEAGLETAPKAFWTNPVRFPSLDKGKFIENWQTGSRVSGSLPPENWFAWLTVLNNVLFPLKLKKEVDIIEARKLAYKYIDMVGLRDVASSYPKQLSGGMRQRVAIARTLINTPDLLLMDEPFGALDAFTREDMQGHLLSIWHSSKNNIVFVTHDIGEAVLLADEIFVMSAAPMQVHA